MSFIINQNFDLKSPQFNFARDFYKDLAALKAACGGDWSNYSSFPDYFITNVGGDLYQYRSSNQADTNTGKWKKLVFGSDVDLSGYLKKTDASSTYSTKAETVTGVSAGPASSTKAGFNVTKNGATITVYYPLADSTTCGIITPTQFEKINNAAADADLTAVKNDLSERVDNKLDKSDIDSKLSSTSTNPVQNKVINTALAGKASTAVASTTANGLLSSTDKTKLDGIADGATKVHVDSTITSNGTNPVQAKAIHAAINDLDTNLSKKINEVATTVSNIQSIPTADIDALFN